MKQAIRTVLTTKTEEGVSGTIYIDTAKDPLPDGTIPEGILTSYFHVPAEVARFVTPGTEVNIVGGDDELENVLFSIRGKVSTVSLYDEELGGSVSLNLPSGNWSTARLSYEYAKSLRPKEILTVSVVKI